MKLQFIVFTSVTRWLLVVIGCAVLETAQPMSSALAAEQPQGQRTSETVIYPQGSPERGAPPASSEGGGSRSWTLLMGALILAGAGAWFFVKRRSPGLIGAGRGARKIVIEETRSLGSRQYLIVAGYEGKKFLIGVTPGQIQLLTALESAREES